MTNDTWNIYSCNGDHTPHGRGSQIISFDSRITTLQFLRDIVIKKIQLDDVQEYLWAERDGIPQDQMDIQDYIPITMSMDCQINPALYAYANKPIPAQYPRCINSCPNPDINTPYAQRISIMRVFNFLLDSYIFVQRQSLYDQDISRDNTPITLFKHNLWVIRIAQPDLSNPHNMNLIHKQSIVIDPTNIPCNNPTMRDILTHGIMEHHNLSYSQHERIRLLRQLYDHPNIDLDTTIPDQWSHNTPS